MQILKMTGAGAAGTITNGVATLDIPEDGALLGVDWELRADTQPADNDVGRAELSFLATNQFDTNDSRGSISSIGSSFSVTTSGATNTGQNKYVPMSDPLIVAGGERLFVHTESVGVPTVDFTCHIHFRPGKTRARRSQRRR